MIDRPVRVGLVGAGPWAGSVHAPGLAAHPGTELVSVWARRPDAASGLATVHHAEVAGSFEEMLAGVDAVSFAVPPAVQAPLALAAIQAGKHVILEKPVAASVVEAERMVEAASQTGVATIVVLTLRFAPEISGWLDEVRELGGWRGATARWLSGALLGGEYANSPWRQDQGALADVGPHAFDLLDLALGEITGVIAAHRGEPDVWHTVLGHASGATSTATLSLRLPMRPTITDLSLYGEHGYRELPERSTTAQASFAALLDDFVAMVRAGRTDHPCDLRRGLHLQRVLEVAARMANGSQ